MENLVMNPFAEFWEGKRVLITGHTGFKGSWLTKILVDSGARVTGVSLPLNDSNSFFQSLELQRKIIHHEADISQRGALYESIFRENYDFIFHFAAQSIVSESYKDPFNTWNSNVMTTALLIDEVINRAVSDCVLLIATTDKVYRDNAEQKAYTEGDPLGGADPYSASKVAVETLIESSKLSFLDRLKSQNIKVVTLRAGNVVGGGDWSLNRLMPDIARSAINRSAISVRNPNSVRPWQHVFDVLNGYLTLAEYVCVSPEHDAGAWNFGPDWKNFHTVEDVLNKVIETWDIDVSLEKSSSFTESPFLSLDSEKVRTTVGWRPLLDFSRTIELTVEWYKTFVLETKTTSIENEQLAYFFNLKSQPQS